MDYKKVATAVKRRSRHLAHGGEVMDMEQCDDCAVQMNGQDTDFLSDEAEHTEAPESLTYPDPDDTEGDGPRPSRLDRIMKGRMSRRR